VNVVDNHNVDRPRSGSHALLEHLDKLAACRGHILIYPAGWELGEREKAAITASRPTPPAWRAAAAASAGSSPRTGPGPQRSPGPGSGSALSRTPPDQHEPSLRARKETTGAWNPGSPARQPGRGHDRVQPKQAFQAPADRDPSAGRRVNGQG
jgi:hypothetical protein